jgi:putative glutamine amidotransferase
MERGGERFCVGVQWHPETATDVGLVAGLVRAAAAYAEDR